MDYLKTASLLIGSRRKINVTDNTVRFEVLKIIGTLKSFLKFDDNTDNPIILEARRQHTEHTQRLIDMFKDCHTAEEFNAIADKLEKNPPVPYDEILRNLIKEHQNSDAG